MNIQRILCPIDFSESNSAAIGYASALAKSSGATIDFVHVTLPAAPFGAEHLYVTVPELNEEVGRQLQSYQPTDPQIPHKHHVLEGHPADAIVQFAKDQDADLIVMGTHGRTGLTRLLMGSVAEQVVRRANCAVLAVKHPLPNES